MLKRFLLSVFFIVLILAALTGYFFLHWRQELRQQQKAVKAPEQQITTIEGWTNRQIAGYLEQKGIISANAFLAASKTFATGNYPLLASKPDGAGLEGFLFPDTYNLPQNTGGAGTTADMIINKMLSDFTKRVNSISPDADGLASQQGLTLYQAITLASIVEKETGRNAVTQEQKDQLAAERKTIAGIFYNRLKVNMPLQSDATVNFITGKNTPQASLEDTAINSPYNTYKYPGLPPGPICNPSLSSIEAALEPTQSDYFYFLSRPDTGQAVYAKTYQEHLANKQKYLGNN